MSETRKMPSLNRNVKVWILITLCSLLIWIIYWVPSGIDRLFTYNGVPWGTFLQTGSLMFMIMEISAAVGMLIRFVGIFLAILVIKEFWPGNIWNRNKTLFDVKNLIASSLTLESIYFLLLLPSGLLMIGIGRQNPIRFSVLGIDYLLMVLLTVPFLTILGIKIYKIKADNNSFRSWKWTGVTIIGYIAMLWANSVAKWIDILIRKGFQTLFSGITAIGAINSFVLMSLALIFTGVGAFSFANKKLESTFKWFGLTFLCIGLHFLVYVIYSYFIGMFGFLMLAEIWTIPLIGLGFTMYKGS